MQHRRDDLAGLIFESQIIAQAFNVGTLQCSPSFQFRKFNGGVIEIGLGEIAIDLPQARLCTPTEAGLPDRFRVKVLFNGN